jgi:putative addiction module CopG family antidote
MNIRLTPEQEKIIQQELEAGRYSSAEEVIAEALHALREKAQASGAVEGNGNPAEAVREMLAFVEQNRTRLEGVSVKELIREGRRL